MMAHKKGFIKPFNFSDSGAGDKKWEKFQEKFGVLIAWSVFTVSFAAVNKVWSFFSEREFWIILVLSFSLIVVLGYYVPWANRWSRKIAYLTTVILLVFTVWKLVDKTFPGTLPDIKSTKAEYKIEETEFQLQVGRPILTVAIGPGTIHEIWSNKPFLAVAARPDNGQWIKYEMPAGQSSWNGAAPKGHLLLEGISENTIVNILKIR